MKQINKVQPTIMKKIFLGTLALGLLSITACEKQSGCTDPKAINFDSAAEENDGSCIYDTTNTNNSGDVNCDNSTFTWNDVTSPTGKVWMDRNLGAKQVATSSTDAASYGDLYQWGRGKDGHQCRNSNITSTMSPTDTPGHSDFITSDSYDYDWRDSQNDNLWQEENGINNPCPSGYRLPKDDEWEAEIATWTSDDAFGAYGSVLKLPLAGYRNFSNGSLNSVGTLGLYWSSTVSGAHARFLVFDSSNAGMNTTHRAGGYSVRCLKD